MSKRLIYRSSLFLSIGLTLFGVVSKIQLWPGAGLLLSIGLMLNLVYIAIGLYEVFHSKDKSLTEKLVWLIGFLLLSWIVGLIYLFVEMNPKQRLE